MEIPINIMLQVESKWYSYWMKHDYFHSTPVMRAYTIVIPPKCNWGASYGSYVK